MKKNVIIVIVVFCLGILSLIFLGDNLFPFLDGDFPKNERDQDEKTFQARTYTHIERESGFKLPPNAKGLNFYYWPPIDPGFAAKLRIPFESKAQLITQIEKIQNTGNAIFTPVGARQKWWISENAKIILERKVENGSSYFLIFLVEEGEDLILYLEYSVI